MSRHVATALTAALVTTILLTSAATGGASAPGQQPPANVTPPTISGAAVVGSALTAAPATWSGKALKYAYQWLRCDSSGGGCGAIAGAGATTYAPFAADTSATMRVMVTATNKNGSAAATSAATAPVAGAPSAPTVPPPPAATPPSVTSAPTITGTAQQGETLSASTGTWSGTTPITYTYQWQRCDSGGASCAPIASVTAATYVVASADVGSTIRASVTASNSGGSATASSAPTSVVAAAPLPISPVNGTVLYKASWEYGSGGLYQGLDPQQWGHQCADNTSANSAGVQRGTYTAVTGDTDSGTYAGRFDLPANTNYAQACEALHSRTVGALGSDDYYALAVKFPTNWQEPSMAFWGLALSQFNYEGINSSPLGLSAHTDNITLVVNAGACPPPGGNTGCPYYSGNNGDTARNIPGGPFYAVPKGQLALDVWHELIVHVHWALDSTGAVEVWHRLKGGSWTATVSAAGFPTLQTGTTFSGTVVTASNISSLADVDKFGVYRGPASFTATIYQDDWCRATSFSSAASCLA